jgi:hypothetical protein
MRHEVTNLGLGLGPNPSAIPNLLDERFIVQGEDAELPGRHAMRLAEIVDVMNEVCHVRGYRLDQTNQSSWNVNTYPKCPLPWENGTMATNQFNFDSVREALAREIREGGFKPTNLSQKISKTNKSLVKNILDDGKDIHLGTLTKLADEMGINVARLIPWARPEPSEPIPIEAIRVMLEGAMRELPLGATVEDYLRIVPQALHERLGQFLAGGAFPSSAEEVSAHDTGAPPPAPTKPGVEA